MCTTLCTVNETPPILRRSPLQIVAVELRYPETVLVPEDLKQLRRGLSEHYPSSGTEHALNIELTPEGLRQQQGSQRYVYRTVDGSHQVGLTPNTLVLEGRGAGYEGFKHFLERWLIALDIVVPVVEITNQLRLGMRYINQLKVDDVEPGLSALEERVNPTLLAPLGANGFGFEVATSFQELRLHNEHGKATLRHGLQVAPEGATPPGIYLLDIDFYDDAIKPFERGLHFEQLKMFNLQIWDIFRWSLTDTEFERMEPEDRE